MYLRKTIETYLKASGTPATRFGREAVRDPRLVHDLRKGREVGPRLAKRIIAFIAERSA
jgi:2,4-dienoyl-CoA reductase-like NADH-dependent reductase (Old Yellow Enzyme family)